MVSRKYKKYKTPEAKEMGTQVMDSGTTRGKTARGVLAGGRLE